jgi:predicted unusual protein kinase regulating ubiquinone biosynthesis (AarF/ABC1/UbiB family)
VHTAVLDDGTEVAVKVQYPGVDRSIEADLAQLDLAKLIMPAVWRSLDAKAVAKELRERLLEELDYTVEASNQRDFASWYTNHPFIHIPRVIDEFSTKRVLTTEYVDAERFARFETRTQAERDRAAEIIFRFVFRSLNDHLAFNGDPHPGNYLFTSGKVSFLDFGVVKRFTPADYNLTLEIGRTVAIEPNPATHRVAVEKAGFFSPGNPLSDDQIFRFSSILWSYMAEDRPITVTSASASETVRQYLFKGEEFAELNKWGAVPPQFVILQRITVGLTAVLGRLNATANWHRILKELWFGGPPASPLGEQEAIWLEG